MGRVGQIVYVITQKLAGLLVMIDYRVGEWVKKGQNLDYVIFEWSAKKKSIVYCSKIQIQWVTWPIVSWNGQNLGNWFILVENSNIKVLSSAQLLVTWPILWQCWSCDTWPIAWQCWSCGKRNKFQKLFCNPGYQILFTPPPYMSLYWGKMNTKSAVYCHLVLKSGIKSLTYLCKMQHQCRTWSRVEVCYGNL